MYHDHALEARQYYFFLLSYHIAIYGWDERPTKPTLIEFLDILVILAKTMRLKDEELGSTS